LARTSPPFAEHRAVGVVVQRGRQSQGVAQALPQGHVDPAEIRRQQDNALVNVERPRSADPDADDLEAGDLPSRGRHAPPGQLHDPVHDRVGPLLRPGRLAHQGEERIAILPDAPGDDVGPAQVDADDRSHGALQV